MRWRTGLGICALLASGACAKDSCKERGYGGQVFDGSAGGDIASMFGVPERYRTHEYRFKDTNCDKRGDVLEFYERAASGLLLRATVRISADTKDITAVKRDGFVDILLPAEYSDEFQGFYKFLQKKKMQPSGGYAISALSFRN